jgi:hypothetical protein
VVTKRLQQPDVDLDAIARAAAMTFAEMSQAAPS